MKEINLVAVLDKNNENILYKFATEDKDFAIKWAAKFNGIMSQYGDITTIGGKKSFMSSFKEKSPMAFMIQDIKLV